MRRGPDAATLLERALLASAAHAGCPVSVAAAEARRWASITFTGARHRLTLAAAPSPALDAWIAALPEAELPLRGHLVADGVVTRVRRTGATVAIDAEFLTVEDG